MKIYLAPLQSYTGVEFRRAWGHHFTGIDVAVSPFIPLTGSLKFGSKHLRDVLPEMNKCLPVIPQVLGNDPQQFVFLASVLQELGYETVNWNLGCPKKSVARKKRGSGLLPYPDELRKILDEIVPRLPVALSVKTRLGYHSPGEFDELIRVFNDYPLESLMIHPRIGIQMYEGDMHLNVLDETVKAIKTNIVFSGDIFDLRSFEKLKKRFPVINDWMIGRGILTNPMLPEWIKTGRYENDETRIRQTLQGFHASLLDELLERFSGSRPVLNKLKGFWAYFARWFQNGEKLFQTLSRIDTPEKFIIFAKKIINEHPLARAEGRTNKPIK